MQWRQKRVSSHDSGSHLLKKECTQRRDQYALVHENLDFSFAKLVTGAFEAWHITPTQTTA